MASNSYSRRLLGDGGVVVYEMKGGSAEMAKVMAGLERMTADELLGAACHWLDYSVDERTMPHGLAYIQAREYVTEWYWRRYTASGDGSSAGDGSLLEVIAPRSGGLLVDAGQWQRGVVVKVKRGLKLLAGQVGAMAALQQGWWEVRDVVLFDHQRPASGWAMASGGGCDERLLAVQRGVVKQIYDRVEAVVRAVNEVVEERREEMRHVFGVAVAGDGRCDGPCDGVVMSGDGVVMACDGEAMSGDGQAVGGAFGPAIGLGDDREVAKAEARVRSVARTVRATFNYEQTVQHGRSVVVWNATDDVVVPRLAAAAGTVARQLVEARDYWAEHYAYAQADGLLFPSARATATTSATASMMMMPCQCLLGGVSYARWVTAPPPRTTPAAMIMMSSAGGGVGTKKRKRSGIEMADVVERMLLSGRIQALVGGGVPRPLGQYAMQRAEDGRVMAERLHWTVVVPSHVVALLMAFHPRLGQTSALGQWLGDADEGAGRLVVELAFYSSSSA